MHLSTMWCGQRDVQGSVAGLAIGQDLGYVGQIMIVCCVLISQIAFLVRAVFLFQRNSPININNKVCGQT